MTWPEAVYGSAALLAACGALWAVLRAGVDIYAVHHYAARYAVPMPRSEELEPAVGHGVAGDVEDDSDDSDNEDSRPWAFPRGKKPSDGP